MKKLLLILLALCCLSIFSQGIKVKVYPGKPMNEQIDSTIQYVFPDFRVGKVFFNDGTFLLTLLNYNILLEEMHFYDQGKKMQLGRIEDIANINFSNRIFKQIDNKFFELIVTGKNELLLKRNSRIIDVGGKVVGYGGTSQLSSVSSASSISSGGSRIMELPSVEKEIVINIDSIYYLNVDNKVKVINGIRTIRSLNKKYEKQIDEFVYENKTDVQNYTNLKALIKYVNSLD